MTIFFLLLSAILLIGTFGIFIMYRERRTFGQPLIFYRPEAAAIALISGFVLPVIPFTLVFHYPWLAIFMINIAVVYIAGPACTRAFLKRFRSKKGPGYDMIYAFSGGLISLTIGLVLHFRIFK